MNQAPAQVTEIVANVDDASGEVIGAAVEAVLAAGALDVWTTAIGMKKNRPGIMVSVLCNAADRPRLARLLIELTGTFGVRYRDWDRLVLDRRHAAVETPYGAIRLKIGELDGRPIVVKPEYEDAKLAAEKHGVSVRTVMAAARVENQV